jgi:trans-aconitate 2-methyltransferase
VVGLDRSADMLEQARRNYPDLEFVQADATSFRFEQPFDAVFSNAALHWVKNGGAAVESIAAALGPGGRFLAEFGGKGNIATILDAIAAVFGPDAEQRCPWWYPGVAEYASLVEHYGLEVRQASLFDRPTPIEGESAMADWIAMFCGAYFRDLPEQRVRELTRELVERLRPNLYNAGIWTLDYRRLRIGAVKQ